MVELSPSSARGPIAVVGCGVIGRSWALLFARAGRETRLYDRDPAQVARAEDWLAETVKRESRSGIDVVWNLEATLSRLMATSDLERAVRDVVYVQESSPEDLAIKRRLFADLDAVTPRNAVLASSTSTFDMTEVALDLAGATRCIVAHPVNPPHQLPVVEVLAGRHTHPTTVEATRRMLVAVGQRPVVLDKFARGFVLNRLQFALVREAMHLLHAGVASVDAIDTVVREGLGPRWALLGPFGVADANNDGGIRAYYRGHERLTMDLMNDLGPTPTIDDEFVERMGSAVDEMFGGVDRADIRQWRDRMLRVIRDAKAANPLPQVGIIDIASNSPTPSDDGSSL